MSTSASLKCFASNPIAGCCELESARYAAYGFSESELKKKFTDEVAETGSGIGPFENGRIKIFPMYGYELTFKHGRVYKTRLYMQNDRCQPTAYKKWMTERQCLQNLLKDLLSRRSFNARCVQAIQQRIAQLKMVN